VSPHFKTAVIKHSAISSYCKHVRIEKHVSRNLLFRFQRLLCCRFGHTQFRYNSARCGSNGIAEHFPYSPGYQGKQFDEAKQYFSQAVTEAPQSGPAHYNYALALNALGQAEEARKHFIEAANLAPGDKVIWNSPPLSPYGNPESQIKKTIPQQVPGRRGGPGGGGGGYP
jgi:tetratricopeptide (TPR) repeat protein